jgi:drug/metabolite transporter (DMT)-like permease
MLTNNLVVPKLAQGAAILLSVVAVAIADVMLKKAATHGDLILAFRSPWLATAIGLYLFQIGLFTIVFIAGWKLSIIGALQTALYALIVLAAGVLFFRETLTQIQVAGILLAIGGVVLINWPQ